MFLKGKLGDNIDVSEGGKIGAKTETNRLVQLLRQMKIMTWIGGVILGIGKRETNSTGRAKKNSLEGAKEGTLWIMAEADDSGSYLNSSAK